MPAHGFASLLSMPKAAYVILILSLGSLAFAYAMQYGFNFHPCVLCLWQRVPFGIAAILALAAIIWVPYGQRTRILLACCALAFFINAGVATFHSGVERQWWMGTSGCSIKPLHGTDAASLREELLGTAVARCDVITWNIMGLSMANFNIPFCAMLGIFAAAAARKRRKLF